MRRDGCKFCVALHATVIVCLSFRVLVGAAEPIDVSKLPPPSSQAVDFVRDVQPLFQKTCYSCHGPEKQESGLRLDKKQRAFNGGDNGKALIAGNSAGSRLVQLVAGLDEDVGRMPPEGEGTPLTSEQIGILRAWIDQGAHWPDQAKATTSPTDLWSLKPLQRPSLPAVKDSSWISSPVDRFVLARLETEKIAPSPSASRETLLRRLYLDLLGLPPSPDELAEYLTDNRPDAYECLVDRLLASPHFGERWGRHWLDLARYADSDGYEKDRPRPFAWRYRNWVLEAVNADLPFDQFTVEQIAGDMLPQASLDQRVASGFHRNTLHNTEGGIDPEEDRVKKTVDRTNTMGTIWLGLTVGCAQCHSHKYDPLTQREYYQLYGFFNNIDEQDIDAPLDVQRELYARAKGAFDAKHAPFLEAIRKYETEKLAAAQLEWEKTALTSAVVWTSLDPTSAVSRHGAKLEKQADLSLLARGENEESDVYEVEAATGVRSIRAIRIEVLPDDSLPKKGPGRADNGNFVLASFHVELLLPDSPGTPSKLVLQKAQADFSQKQCDVVHAINDNPGDFWAVAPEFGKRHVAVFEIQQPAELPEGAQLKITLDQHYEKGQPHNLGRFRLSVTDATGPISLEGLPSNVASALAVVPAQRTPEQSKSVTDYYRSVDAELIKLVTAAENHAKNAPPPLDTKAQSIVQHDPLRATNIHVRGDFLNPGDPVEVLTPAWLPAIRPRGAKPDRLDLASWLVSGENSLTSRVAVNRIWDKLFGRGIVRTVDDFGKQGEPPSHPDLLDWLAIEFRESAWSTKRILRLIVTSSAYRQSSATRTELASIDPDNALLARQSRRRVEAEVIRDLSLVVSGLYDSRLGGPSVRPPQPAEYSKLTYANSASWPESKGGDRYRRGMYTFFQRTSPYPMLMTFDSPDSNECCVQRESSNTPLQALTLWNDPAFFEFAQAFGRRVIADVPSTADSQQTLRDRASYAFTLCLARSPSPEELDEILNLFAAQLARYQENPAQAAETNGKAQLVGQLPAEEVAAWTVVARSLLNLDEFITRE